MSTNFSLKKASRRMLPINRTKLLIIIFGLISVIWLLLLAYLPYFRITSFTAAGLDVVKKSSLDQFLNEYLAKRPRWLPSTSYFFIPTASIREKLLANFPFSSVTLEKKFPHEVFITVEEKISTLIYDSGQDYYLLDQHGEIIKYLKPVGTDEFVIKTQIVSSTLAGVRLASSTITGGGASTSSTAPQPTTRSIRSHLPNYKRLAQDFGRYPLVYNRDHSSNLTTTTTTVELDPTQIAGILKWRELILEWGKILPTYFVIEKERSGIAMMTTDRFAIYFQPTADVVSQFNMLKNIIKELKPTQYIDVRYEGRIYWK